jgi:hypothetical protein
MVFPALTHEAPQRAACMKAALEQVLKPPRPQVLNVSGRESGGVVKAWTKDRPDALSPPAKDRDRSRR